MASGFVEKLKGNVELDRARLERAYTETPDPYRKFIVIIEQNQVVARKELQIDKELEELGCFTSNSKTYQRRQTPYMAVDGRIKQMVDEHREKDAKFSFSQEIDWDHLVLTVTFESELYGKTVGSAKIGMGGSGADSTNPVENSQTSAVGRALAQAGYGLFGTGSIASAEEMQAFLRESGEEHESTSQASSSSSNGRAKPNGRAASNGKPKAQATKPEANGASNGQAQTEGKRSQEEKPSELAKPAEPAKPAQQAKPTEQAEEPARATAGAAPQYDPAEVRRLIQIKSRLAITTNEGLNEYVVQFGKSIGDERISRYTHLVGDLLAKFNDYMEAQPAEKAS